MANAEYPPLGRSYVISYSNGDKDFPIIAIKKDPRVDNYRRPDDLSPHPDSTRYPNHVFTGTQPTNTDERVIWIYEILPSPWIPFTRYDDDLGPVQGRRRSVANTGQEASLERDKRVAYEAREGSAIVSTELEETWDAGFTDPDEPSPFPIRDRDFYDPSRGAVQERRQLVSATGNEVATLENNNGVITQTSYEAYNEFLSFKIVQTYRVDGPQLVGNTTNNEGQLVTITTQRKASENYVIPQLSATRTVEVNREDAATVVERTLDIPEVFNNKLLSKESVDPAPAKFRIAAPATTEEETMAGTVENPVLNTGDISKSEQQITKFVKRIRSTFRNLIDLPKILTQKSTNNQGQIVTITETLQQGDTSDVPSATVNIESEALGDGTYIIRKTEVPEIFEEKTVLKTRIDITPEKFKAKQEEVTTEKIENGTVNDSFLLAVGEFKKSEQQITKFLKRTSTTSRQTQTTESIEEKIVTNQGQLATRTLFLAASDQDIQIDEKLIDGSVEQLGDGRSVKTEVRVDKIFDEKSKTLRQVIRIPEKFISAIETESEIISSTEATPDPLGEGGSGIIESESQRITEFKARETKTTQNIIETISEGQTNNLKQNITVTSTIQNEGAINAAEIDAKTEFIRIQSIGGGKFVKEVGKSDSFFEQKSFTKERPDPAPQKFRIETPSLTEEFNEEKTAASEEDVNLEDDDLAKTVQQIDAQTIRIKKTKREETQDQIIDGGKIFTTELTGGVANVVEKYHTGAQLPEVGLGTISAESEALGANKFLTRTVKIDQPQELSGSIYDEQFDAQIKFSRKIVEPTDLNPDDSSETTPRDPYQSIQTVYNIGEIHSSLLKKSFTVGDIVNISLPDTLQSLKIITDTASDAGIQDSSGSGNTVTVSGQVGVEIDADFMAEIKTGYSGPARAIRHFFFLPSTNASMDDILSKTNSSMWPAFKPQSVSFSLTLRQKSERGTIQLSLPNNQAVNTEEDESVKVRVINIPPTLHGPVSIQAPDFGQGFSKQIKVTKPNGLLISTSISASASMNTEGAITQTSPSSITGGNYLYSVSSSPYKYGLIRIEAVTIDLTPYV